MMLTNEKDSSSYQGSLFSVIRILYYLAQLVEGTVAKVCAHHLFHGVPGITGDVGQVDHSAHTGDEVDQGLWWYITIHHYTLQDIKTLEDLLVIAGVATDLSKSQYKPDNHGLVEKG